jgi:predicted secreted protein
MAEKETGGRSEVSDLWGTAAKALLLQLRPGETHELALPSLGTAGYRWIDKIASGDGVVEISRHRGPAVAGDGPVAGRSTAELLLVRALSPGHAHIELSQRRPWETDVPPRAKLQVNVEVIDPGR